jgi:hypothetical protein
VSWARNRLHDEFGCDGTFECCRVGDLLQQVADDRAHRDAEVLRAQARRIEVEYGDKHGEVYKLYLYGAKELRRAASNLDPYDNVPGTNILVRKSDGRHVMRE